jgi:hypothetical protein
MKGIKGKLILFLPLSFCCSWVHSLKLKLKVKEQAAICFKSKIVAQKSADELQLYRSPQESLFVTRRNTLIGSMTAGLLMGAIFFPQLALPEGNDDLPTLAVTKYYTGKQPVTPGGKPREKGDVKGTKKDPQFLLSISQCKVRGI